MQADVNHCCATTCASVHTLRMLKADQKLTFIVRFILGICQIIKVKRVFSSFLLGSGPLPSTGVRVRVCPMLKAFRYSGAKGRIIPLLRPIPAYITKVIEPFAGSLSFALNSERPFLAWDTSEELVALWSWLKAVSHQELRSLQQYQGMQKVDVRSLPICAEAKTYLRINIASVMTGQLSSWSIYPQHKLPVDKTIEALPAIRKGTCYHGNAHILTVSPCDTHGAMLFLDPPYINTKGNYSDINKGDHQAIATVKELVKTFKNIPITLTYGDGAEDVFPDYPWETVLVRKVPNIRCGGTVERREKVAYLGAW